MFSLRIVKYSFCCGHLLIPYVNYRIHLFIASLLRKLQDLFLLTFYFYLYVHVNVYVCAYSHVCGCWWRLRVMDLLELGIKPGASGIATSALNH